MIRQTHSNQKWETLFSSLRCSCRIDDFCQAYLRWRVMTVMTLIFGITWFTLLEKTMTIVLKKNNPHTWNHGISIVGTAKDQKTWHMSYRNYPQNGNHVIGSNCQTRNYDNCVIGTTVSLETVATDSQEHVLAWKPCQLCYRYIPQKEGHGNWVTGTWFRLETMAAAL